MKKLKYFIIFFFLFIISILILLFSGNEIASAFENSNSKELSDVENAIIIKGIESGEDNIQNDSIINSLKGSIIYNDSFNIISPNKKKNYITKNENIITKLQMQDSRWHLTSYRIKKGENLWSLAKKFNTDYKTIIKVNDISEPNRLNPCNTILIPNRNGLSHKVSANETLIKLAKKYSVKKESIIFNNKIKNNIIKEGDFLFIPDAVESEEKIVKYTKIKTTINNDLIDDEEEITLRKEYQKKIKLKFSWPLKGKITSAFGKRKNPLNSKERFHCGLDIAANIGTPISASDDGEAIFSGWKKGYGRVVILKHTDGYISVYAHNKKNLIKTGDFIESGDVIALSGISGAVTGPHLHFEIRKYLTPLNPLRLLE